MVPLPTPQAALSAYLRKTLGSKAPAGPLEISQFSHGQSNPTYFLKVKPCLGFALFEYFLRRQMAGEGPLAWQGRLLSFTSFETPTLAIRWLPALQSFIPRNAQAGGQRFVLRKQPPGKVLQSAHAVDREHLIMSRLANTPVPVPRMVRRGSRGQRSMSLMN